MTIDLVRDALLWCFIINVDIAVVVSVLYVGT